MPRWSDIKKIVNAFGRGLFYGGERYEGDTLNGNRHGNGIVYDIFDALKYEGHLENNLYHGKGKTFYDTGSILYDGEWYNGYRHGIGTLYNQCGYETSSGYWVMGRLDEYREVCETP
jgi:hypothetical protein